MICTRCGKDKPKEAFNRSFRGKWCVTCQRAYRYAYSQTNKLKIKEHNRKYYAKNQERLVQYARDKRKKLKEN